MEAIFPQELPNAVGSQARDPRWHALVRQGLGADHHSAGRRQWRAALDHGPLLHAVRPFHPSEGHRARHAEPKLRLWIFQPMNEFRYIVAGNTDALLVELSNLHTGEKSLYNRERI